MKGKLNGKKVAILVEDGFEQVELTEPKKVLENEGATTKIVSPCKGKVKGWDHINWGLEFDVNINMNDAKADDFDALLLPGGVMNPDKLRMNDRAIRFIKSFYEDGKPIAAICHAPWLLAEADIIDGREITSYKSIKTDMINAGAEWSDKAVVVDEGLVTSRNPGDLPQFCEKMIEEFAEGVHERQKWDFL